MKKTNKKNSKMRKLLPAFAMLTVSAISLSSATYAWFTMNKTVTVTGMSMKTVVGDSLLIASSSAGTSKSADSSFTNGIHQPVTAILQPVSTINAADNGFYYTYDANANGSKASSSTDVPYTLVSNNIVTAGDDEYQAYLDYVFEIKALNSDSTTAKELRLTELNLLYDGAQLSESAYRVAIFEQDLASSGTAYNERRAYADKIFAPTDYAYFDNTAVSSTTEKAAVSPAVNGATWTKSIAGGANDYTKLTVRLWLEGEDTDCYSTQFVELTKEWTLNLKFDLASGSSDTTTPAAVQLIGSTAKATATDAGLASLSGSETIASYQWYTDNPGAFPETAKSGQTNKQYSGIAGDKVYCEITTAKGTKYRTNTITYTPS
jgi:hypothetical protein